MGMSMHLSVDLYYFSFGYVYASFSRSVLFLFCCGVVLVFTAEDSTGVPNGLFTNVRPCCFKLIDRIIGHSHDGQVINLELLV